MKYLLTDPDGIVVTTLVSCNRYHERREPRFFTEFADALKYAEADGNLIVCELVPVVKVSTQVTRRITVDPLIEVAL